MLICSTFLSYLKNQCLNIRDIYWWGSRMHVKECCLAVPSLSKQVDILTFCTLELFKMENMLIVRLKAPVRYCAGPSHVTKTALTRQLFGSNVKLSKFPTWTLLSTVIFTSFVSGFNILGDCWILLWTWSRIKKYNLYIVNIWWITGWKSPTSSLHREIKHSICVSNNL